MPRRGLIAIIVLVAVAAAACGGGSPQGAPPQGGTATATRDIAEGNPKLTSTILVRFDRAVTLASRQVPLASHFELLIPQASADDIKTVLVLVKDADFVKGSTREVTLQVDRLVPAGTKVVVQKDAFRKDATGTIEIEVESDLDVIGALLASKALAVGDPAVVDPVQAPDLKPEDRDAAAQRAALVAHLAARGTDVASTKRAIDRFDSMGAEIVQSAKARAALAALTGTFAEPAIDSLLTANNCTAKPAAQVVFQVPPDAPKLFARVTYTQDGRRVVSLNPSIEGERIEMLMPILLHEAIHCDRVGGRFEEVAATAIDSFFYVNLLAVFPELATSGTPLAREFNVDAIALINSGRKIPESLGILRSPGVTRVLPGTNAAFGSFADLVAAAYPSIDFNESPQEPLAQAYVAALAGAVGMSVASAFNLVYLDELIGRAASPELVQRAIIALNLRPES